MKNKVLNVERFHWSNATDAQVLRHVGELARLNEKVGVVDQCYGAERAGVVLWPHPTAVKDTAIEEKLQGALERGEGEGQRRRS